MVNHTPCCPRSPSHRRTMRTSDCPVLASVLYLWIFIPQRDPVPFHSLIISLGHHVRPVAAVPSAVLRVSSLDLMRFAATCDGTAAHLCCLSTDQVRTAVGYWAVRDNIVGGCRPRRTSRTVRALEFRQRDCPCYLGAQARQRCVMVPTNVPPPRALLMVAKRIYVGWQRVLNYSVLPRMRPLFSVPY